MKTIEEMSIKEICDLLVEGKMYFQHYCNSNMASYFKNVKWFWNKDTTYTRTLVNAVGVH